MYILNFKRNIHYIIIAHTLIFEDTTNQKYIYDIWASSCKWREFLLHQSYFHTTLKVETPAHEIYESEQKPGGHYNHAQVYYTDNI
mgnify:CR=1 FL=1